MNEYLEMWKRGFDFSGRSTRKEYWMAVLFNIIISLIYDVIMYTVNDAGTVIFGIMCIYSLLVMIPGMSLGIRRLHDIGKSGWNYLLLLIPIIGPIMVLVYLCTGTQEDNKYGTN